MNLWYKKALVFVLAGISYCAGFFFSDPTKFGFCSGLQSGSYICRVPGAINIGWPLIDLGQMLVIIAIILLFASASAFHAWLKFSAFYIPITVILVLLIYPIRFSSLSPELTYSQGVYPFGWLYVIISILLIIYKYFVSRRTS
ncbi:MAG: hypothetical protein Q8O94_02600 [bacterium]|nr:hypothetical protein [bacterium]